jgi:hypothetical protein
MTPRTRRLAVLLLVGLLVVPGQAAGAVSGSPELSVSLADETVTSGDDTTLSFTLTNEGQVDQGAGGSLGDVVTTARGVDATLHANGAPIEIETGTQSLGRLQQGGQAQLGYDISVDEDADPGRYTLELAVEYQYTSTISESIGSRNHDTATREFDVAVVIDDRARFEIVSTDANVRVGASGTVDVTMRNTGSETANATSVALESQNTDLTFDGTTTTTRYAGDWEPSETRTLSYRVTAAPDARQQRYGFSATATFEDENGVTHTSETLSLGVTPQPEQSFTVVGVDEDVTIGDTGTIAVTLRNTGSIPVTDATVTLESRTGRLQFGNGSSASRFVGEWEPSAERTTTYDVTVTDDAETRQYALQATVGYDDPDGDSATSAPLAFGVTPSPDQGFTLSNVSSTLRVGEEGTLRGTITNEGATTARNVVVRFTTDAQQINPVTRSYAVGSLEPGTSATFDISAEVTSAADAGYRQLSFVADYRTSEGQQRTSDDLLVRERIGSGGDVFAVEPVNATYSPGSGGELAVRVTNTGTETLSSISAKLFADDPISADTKEAFIEELGPGESTVVTLEASVTSGALPKTYPVSLDFQYEDSDGDTHVSDSYQVAVTVREPTESDGGGGGPPLALFGLGAVGIVGVGGYLRFRG